MKKILLTIMFLSIVSGFSFGQDLYWGGFVEGLWTGGFNDNNPTGNDYMAAEARLQLRLESFGDNSEAFARLDFVQDGFNSEQYYFDVREAYAKFTMSIGIDFKVGRQVLTWGTGDLIFINDVFGKDYQSFFIGRQDQYLKAPQTALRAEWYGNLGSLALVAIPDFEPNILPTGERISFYNPQSDAIVGPEGYILPIEPENSFDNVEIAVRYSKMIGGVNFSGYGYRGFYKDPMGFDPMAGEIFFPRLNVYGASLRGQAGGGVYWLEGGYYDSRQDSKGNNFFIINSSLKAMAGFERQVATDLTANLQFQFEQMGEYDDYEKSHNLASIQAAMMSMPQPVKAEKNRTLVTSRWSKQLYSQTVLISLFGFYSPSDEDAYVRFSTEYKYSDELSIMIGGNIFDGKHHHTPFGQFDLNDNAYLKFNYGF
ncbi:MAG: hypothetical protein V3V99_06375 [candidate division Zixibacteria bacterium]